MEKLNDYIICNMDMSHLDGIVEIERLSFHTPWSRNDFISELQVNKTARYRVIMLNDKVIAYGGMWILVDESHITNVAVHPEFRGIGLGDVLMKDMIECAKNNGASSMTLEVRVGNRTAINYYKKWGFDEIAVRRGYYADTGEDAIIMWKYNL